MMQLQSKVINMIKGLPESVSCKLHDIQNNLSITRESNQLNRKKRKQNYINNETEWKTK